MESTKKESVLQKKYLIPMICAALVTTSFGVRMTITSVFVTPISEYFGIGRATFMLWQTIVNVIALISTPLWGRAIKKMGLVKPVLICGIGTTVGFILWPLAKNVYWIYASAVLWGIFNSPVSLVCVSICVTEWFRKDTGKMLGIAFMPLSLNTVIWPLFMPELITKIGWQTAVWLYVIANFVMTVPFAFGLRSPEERGVAPYGAGDAANQTAAPLKGVDYSSALKLPAFYILWIGILLAQMPMGFMSSTVAWGTDHGFDPAKAGLLLSVIAFVGVFGTPCCWHIGR